MLAREQARPQRSSRGATFNPDNGYPPKAKGDQPMIEMTTSQMSEKQRALYNVLDLKRYLAG